MNVIIVLFACVAHVNSKFHCVGTCFSGPFYPEPDDIFRGKHLKGYSYKNITTEDLKKCYSACIHDCRCKACQMKNTRCELLDKDKTTRANDFLDDPGYVYFDLRQEFYKGKSHMVQPGKCVNGCCRSQPCMNGGTCIEHCDTPKEKFSCKCTKHYTGHVCEKDITRCYDVLKYSSSRQTPANGKYTITRQDRGNKFDMYCAFTSNQSWTLIESFSLANNDYFAKQAFYSIRFRRNVDDPNWVDYHTSLNRINYVRSTATLFRATCDFPNRLNDSLTPDYLLGNLRDFDITNPNNDPFSKCVRYMHINILGHECFDCTAATHQRDTIHIHIDVSILKGCDFNPSLAPSLDSFGAYGVTDKASKCTATPQSTTQWWLGEEK